MPPWHGCEKQIQHKFNSFPTLRCRNNDLNLLGALKDLCRKLWGKDSTVRNMQESLNDNGVFNFHSTRVWADENPHAVMKSKGNVRFSLNIWMVITRSGYFTRLMNRLSIRWCSDAFFDYRLRAFTPNLWTKLGRKGRTYTMACQIAWFKPFCVNISKH